MKKMTIKKPKPNWPLLFSFLRNKGIRANQIQKRTGIHEKALYALSNGKTKMPLKPKPKQLEDLAREELTLEQLVRVGFE